MVHFACQDGRGGVRGKRMVGTWQADLLPECEDDGQDIEPEVF